MAIPEGAWYWQWAVWWIGDLSKSRSFTLQKILLSFIVALTFPVFYLLRLLLRQSKNEIEPLPGNSLGTNCRSLIHWAWSWKWSDWVQWNFWRSMV